MIKSINTFYNGNYYRSRLEARWAYFFDLSSYRFMYEPEGYVTDCGCYLVDFYLPDLDCYAEVKPDFQLESGEDLLLQTDQKSSIYDTFFIKKHVAYPRWKSFVNGIKKDLFILIGNPMVTFYPVILGKPNEDGDDMAYTCFLSEKVYDKLKINKKMDFFNKSSFDFDGEWERRCNLAAMKRFEFL